MLAHENRSKYTWDCPPGFGLEAGAAAGELGGESGQGRRSRFTPPGPRQPFDHDLTGPLESVQAEFAKEYHDYPAAHRQPGLALKLLQAGRVLDRDVTVQTPG
jgi:hypothetical protein